MNDVTHELVVKNLHDYKVKIGNGNSPAPTLPSTALVLHLGLHSVNPKRCWLFGQLRRRGWVSKWPYDS